MLTIYKLVQYFGGKNFSFREMKQVIFLYQKIAKGSQG